jgi:uncharacterized phiE125 gp8 family phage protein
MLTTLEIIVPPKCEPIDLDLLRRHIRIDHFDDDVLLRGYLAAARSMAEMYLSRVLVTQTLQWTMQPRDAVWPERHHLHWTLELPRSPVQSIVSIQVNDERGNETTILPAVLPVVPPAGMHGYKADLAFTPSRVKIGRTTLLIDGRTLSRTNIESVQVVFVAGYGDPEAIPQPILDAIMLTAAYLYENRGDAGGNEMPRAVEWLLDPYRIMFLG